MKKVLSFISVSILGLFLFVGTSSAVPLFTNWTFSIGDDELNVPEYMKFQGQGYVENTPTEVAGIYNFEEWAVFLAEGATFGQSFEREFGFDAQLTGILTASGTVDATGVDQQITFNEGSLGLWVNDAQRTYGETSDNFFGARTGEQIAEFILDSGSGLFDPNLEPPEGHFSTLFTSEWISEGYFFDRQGNDLAFMMDPIAVSNVTATYMVPDLTQDAWNRFIQGLENFAGLENTADSQLPLAFFFDSSGEFRPGADVPVPVPEPASMFLFGAGLLGLAAFGRKKMMKKD